MSENIDLKSLEKKAYRAVFNDGLWDLFIGLIILNMGIYPLIGSLFNLPEIWNTFITSLVWNIMTFLVFYLGKKYITIPRIGFVEFGPKRKSKQQKLKIILFGFFIMNIILLIFPFTGLIRNIPLEPLLFALFIGMGALTFPFCVVAYFLDYTRLYYYAFFAGLGFFLTELLYPIVGSPLDSFLSYGITGCVIVLIGLYYFIRFLKKYPLSE